MRNECSRKGWRAAASSPFTSRHSPAVSSWQLSDCHWATAHLLFDLLWTVNIQSGQSPPKDELSCSDSKPSNLTNGRPNCTANWQASQAENYQRAPIRRKLLMGQQRRPQPKRLAAKLR